MRSIKLMFWGFLAGLTVLWLLADTFWPQPFGYFTFRRVFVQYSGVIAIGCMSVSMLLALRLPRVETWVKGLDKGYRLHKWLGIGGLVAAVLHWWWVSGTRWLVDWGWLIKPAHKKHSHEGLPALEQWLRSQKDVAEFIGEWFFYALVVLVAVALIRRIPYHWFRRTHKVLAVVYLGLAYHTLVLTKFEYWSQPLGWVLLVLIVPGCGAAVISLCGRIGARRKVVGEIKGRHYYPHARVLELTVKVGEGWPGHKAGQFAFVTSSKHEGAHPYTIASAWSADSRELTFFTKGLGDWTNQLPAWLQEGMEVTVEGPYGCFDFQAPQTRQIWVAAGIGITPFIARMKYLAQHPGEQEIDFFYTGRAADAKLTERLYADAKAAGVNLHLIRTPAQTRLDADFISAAVPEFSQASVWYCGPAGLGEALREGLSAKGLTGDAFHYELFDMR